MKLRHTISIMALAILAAAPAFADQVAVSNIDEFLNFNFDVVDRIYAQSFTTGNDATTLIAVHVVANSSTGGNSRMVLRADNGSGEPGSEVHLLGVEAMAAGQAELTFSSGQFELLPNTTYWLTMGENVIDTGEFLWTGTTSTDESSSLGWTIADQILRSNDGGASWESVAIGGLPTESARIRVQLISDPSDRITFSYTGIVDGMASGGFPNPAPFQAFAGETFTLTYTFDPCAPDVQDGANGISNYFGSITDLEVTVGSNVYSDILDANITVTDASIDRYSIFVNLVGPAVIGYSDISLSLSFLDSTATVFASGALPLVPPNPDDFDTTSMRVSFFDPVDFNDFGEIVVTDVSIVTEKKCTAQPITFSYSGTVDSMASGGFPDAAPFQAFGGDPIDVTFTYDPCFEDNNPSANGDYLGAVSDLQVTVGANVYTDINGGDIIITNNDVNPDQFQVFSFVSGPAVGGISEDIQLRMIFSDSTNTVFATDALPINQPDPDDFNLGAQINLQFTDVNNFDNFGNIITNDVACAGDCVATIGSNLQVTRS